MPAVSENLFLLLVSWVGAHLLPFSSIADDGSSWRRGAVPAFHRRQRVLMETRTLTMFRWKLRTSLCCEHVCRQLPEASKSCRTICIRCRARKSTEYGKMFGSHFQKNPNIMYSSGDATDIEHEQKRRAVEIMSRFQWRTAPPGAVWKTHRHFTGICGQWERRRDSLMLDVVDFHGFQALFRAPSVHCGELDRGR